MSRALEALISSALLLVLVVCALAVAGDRLRQVGTPFSTLTAALEVER
jgi:hypothetical protein